MKKKSLIILGFLAIGLYFYYDKKKKDRLMLYGNANLNITAEEPLSLKIPNQIIQPITHVYSELKEGMLEPKVIKLIPKKIK